MLLAQTAGEEHLQKVRARVFSSLKSVEPFAVSHSAEQPGLLDTRQDQSWLLLFGFSGDSNMSPAVLFAPRTTTGS